MANINYDYDESTEQIMAELYPMRAKAVVVDPELRHSVYHSRLIVKM
jgi:hypothetical protein